MKWWRRLPTRILVVSIACGIAGLFSTYVIAASSAREVLTRNTLPVWVDGWIAYGRARCEASPSNWTASLIPGTHAWAYDAATLRSSNPAAPPVDRDLVARIPKGGDRAVVLHAPFRGGTAVYRAPDPGPCSLVVASWNARVSFVDALQLFLAAALLAGTVAAALGIVAVVRPLTVRIARLKRAAERVGQGAGYEPAEASPADDDLGELSASLDRAHARIREDAVRLEQGQSDLRRHLDDVTHDLRTPIASVLLALEEAADAAREPAQRDLLNGALKDVVYLGALTANLRLASQLREGWDPVEGATSVDLTDAVERVAARARILARRGGIALDVAVPDAPVLVTCDPVAAEQAIGNVVHNAVAYGDRGGHVAVVLEREADRFVLRVEDDGPGVTKSELPRLGERTFRSDEARQRDPRGSGLGLAITAEVCDRCGWALAFEAGSPRGLKVTVEGRTARPEA